MGDDRKIDQVGENVLNRDYEEGVEESRTGGRMF